MANVASVKPKIPINARKPSDGGSLMEFLGKYREVDENELFLYVMSDNNLMAFVLANPVVFDTFRKLLGRTEETKLNRELLDIAIEGNADLRYERVRNILCKLSQLQMTVLHMVIVDTFNYYRALKNRATVCDDKNAAKVYKVLISGIPDYPGSSEAAEISRMGMMGQWRIAHNEVAGQILVGLGEIEEKEMLTFLKQRDINHKASRVEMHGCPLCHGIYPEGNMVKTKLKPYGTEAWVCLTDYNRELAKGDESIVYGEPIMGVPSQPTIPQEQQITEYAEIETAGKLWKKPVVSPEAQANFIEKFPPTMTSEPPYPVKTAVTGNNAIIQTALEEIHAIMKEKKCSMQKAYELWQEGHDGRAVSSKSTKGIRKKGVEEEPAPVPSRLLTPEEITAPLPSRLLTPEEITAPLPSRLLTPDEIMAPVPSRLLTPDEIMAPGTQRPLTQEEMVDLYSLKKEGVKDWAARINDAYWLKDLGDLQDLFIDQHDLNESEVDHVQTLFQIRREEIEKMNDAEIKQIRDSQKAHGII